MSDLLRASYLQPVHVVEIHDAGRWRLQQLGVLKRSNLVGLNWMSASGPAVCPF
jgi:hypothetical protein